MRRISPQFVVRRPQEPRQLKRVHGAVLPQGVEDAINQARLFRFHDYLLSMKATRSEIPLLRAAISSKSRFGLFLIASKFAIFCSSDRIRS